MTLSIKHKEVGDVVEIPREEFERMEATIEFLEDEALQRGVMKSVKQYNEGKSRSWKEVKKDL